MQEKTVVHSTIWGMAILAAAIARGTVPIGMALLLPEATLFGLGISVHYVFAEHPFARVHEGTALFVVCGQLSVLLAPEGLDEMFGMFYGYPLWVIHLATIVIVAAPLLRRIRRRVTQ